MRIQLPSSPLHPNPSPGACRRRGRLAGFAALLIALALLAGPGAVTAVDVLHGWTLGEAEGGIAGDPAAATLLDTNGGFNLTLTGSPLYATLGDGLGVDFENIGGTHNVAATEYYADAVADLAPADTARWGFEAIVRIDILPAENQELAVAEFGTGTDNNGIILQTFGAGAWALHRPGVGIVADSTPVLVGVPQHVVAVLNNGAWQLWVDGTLRGSFATGSQDPGAGIRIGAGNGGNGNNRGFNGVIETVRVFEYTGTFDIYQTLYDGAIPPITDFIEITPAADYEVAWDRNEGNFSTPDSPAVVLENDASVSRGAVAFGSSELDFGVHYIPNVNDGLYGNAHSWMPDWSASPDPAPVIGIDFGRRILLRNIAWGRDNGDAGERVEPFTDRSLGVYVVQVTTVPNPGLETPAACGPTPEAGWATIATINYKADNGTYFNSYLRHRFNVTQNGSPVPATGLRILVSPNTTAIDEIEVNANQAVEQAALEIVSALGVSLTWDGNDGDFVDPAAGAAPPDNQALASQGTVAFGSSELDFGVHFLVNVNDGLYGNAHSWIPDFAAVPDPAPFVGLNFNGLIAITNIAWSRDNGDTTETGCAGGTCVDRGLGAWVLQYTTVEAPDAATAETGDAATGWADIGTITYAAEAPPFFRSYLRHRFEVSAEGAPLEATGLRIKAPFNTSAIDEIEVNTAVTAPPAPGPVGITAALGYEIQWDGNDGHFNNLLAGAAAPGNDALAANGTTTFGSSELDFGVHYLANVIDGLYGNSHSWIPDFAANPDPAPYVGLNFNRLVLIENIAWSRDNGDAVEAACGGTCTDRATGLYTIQITSVENPGTETPETDEPFTGWATLGTIEYRAAQPPDFNPHLRHRFDVSAGGAPVEATGLRIKVPLNTSCIDEIEVNTATERPAPVLHIAHGEAGTVLSWIYGGGLEVADQLDGPWTCVPDAFPPYSITPGSEPTRYYRIRR